MEWNYSEPNFLDEFVKYIGDNCRLSATLIPNIPEFIDALNNYKYPSLNEISPEIKNKLIPKNQKLSDDQVRILSLFSLCKKHDIYPFWTLSFDDSLSYHKPEIEYEGPKNGSLAPSQYEPYKTFKQPYQFSKQKKWYSIYFKNFINEEAEGVKIAIEQFTKEDYKLVSVYTELNPESRTSDHYYDYEEVDLSLWLANGKIKTFSKIPKNFKMPTTKKDLEKFFYGSAGKKTKI